MPERRRVAVVVPSLARAGAERVAETLAAELVDSCDVTVVTMEPRLVPRALAALPDLPWSDRVPAGCAHRHLAATGGGLRRLLTLVVRFALLARRERFDVVLSVLTWTNVLVALARPLAGRYRQVASEHALAASLRDGSGRLSATARMLPLVYRWPHRVVVVSDAARRSLAVAGLLPRPERAVTVPNPVDGPGVRSRGQEPLEVELPDVERLLVCVARLHPQKDHVTLLRALRLLPDSFGLVLAGDGPARADLADLVEREGLAGRVVFAGVLGNPYPLMRRADVVVLASREEGFGLVAAEAAALGVRFVGSDVGGLREVCDRLGHPVFPVGDAEALARAVQRSLGSPVPPLAADEVDRAFHPAAVAAAYLALGEESPPPGVDHVALGSTVGSPAATG